MAEVLLHVYDVTNSVNVNANTAIVQLNKLMRDGMGVGGIFHGAIQVCLLCLGCPSLFSKEFRTGFQCAYVILSFSLSGVPNSRSSEAHRILLYFNP